jgi:hypothetical protein
MAKAKAHHPGGRQRPSDKERTARADPQETQNTAALTARKKEYMRYELTDEQRVTLYRNTLRVHGTIQLAPAYAEIFQRSNPPAKFEAVDGRPDLVRVTRLRDTVRL